MNQTDLRIAKLLKRGLTCESIARKIGRRGFIERVHRVGCNCKPHNEEKPSDVS